MYLVFLPPGMGWCDAESSFTGPTSHCDFNAHAWDVTCDPTCPAHTLADMAIVPYSLGSTASGAQNALDKAAVTEHEIVETMTNPIGFGWGGPLGEIADTCQLLPATAGVTFPETVNGHPYSLFSLWSNADHGCVTRTPDPVARFRILPGAAGTNTVTLNGKKSTTLAHLVTWKWKFGDGQKASGGLRKARISHTYSAPGTYTAKLTVIDDNGVAATISKTVTAR